MISCSLMGRDKRYISSRLLIFPSLTSLPSLVTGIHSFSSLPPRPRPLPRSPPRPPRPLSPNPPRNPPRSPPGAGAASAISLVEVNQAIIAWDLYHDLHL